MFIIAACSRPCWIQNVFQNFSQQSLYDKKLIIVENGDAVGSCKKLRLEPDILLTSDNHQSHAKNTALDEIKKLGGGFWTTMDDDDYYGPDYLSELNLFRSKGEIIGKSNIFMKTSDDKMYFMEVNQENDFVPMIHGPTISAMAEDSLYFDASEKYGEDLEWINRMINKGARVYSGTRFNFCYRRFNQNHTWSVTDNQILHSSAGKTFLIKQGYCHDIINGHIHGDMIPFTKEPLKMGNNFTIQKIIESISPDDQFNNILKELNVER